MSDKPKIYGSCAAGCLWETPHKEEVDKIKQELAGVAFKTAQTGTPTNGVVPTGGTGAFYIEDEVEVTTANLGAPATAHSKVYKLLAASTLIPFANYTRSVVKINGTFNGVISLNMFYAAPIGKWCVGILKSKYFDGWGLITVTEKYEYTYDLSTAHAENASVATTAESLSGFCMNAGSENSCIISGKGKVFISAIYDDNYYVVSVEDMPKMEGLKFTIEGIDGTWALSYHGGYLCANHVSGYKFDSIDPEGYTAYYETAVNKAREAENAEKVGAFGFDLINDICYPKRIATVTVGDLYEQSGILSYYYYIADYTNLTLSDGLQIDNGTMSVTVTKANDTWLLLSLSPLVVGATYKIPLHVPVANAEEAQTAGWASMASSAGTAAEVVLQKSTAQSFTVTEGVLSSYPTMGANDFYFGVFKSKDTILTGECSYETFFLSRHMPSDSDTDNYTISAPLAKGKYILLSRKKLVATFSGGWIMNAAGETDTSYNGTIYLYKIGTLPSL